MKEENLNKQELTQLEQLLGSQNIHITPTNTIDFIISQFDFEKVHKMMVKVGWDWHLEGIPTVERLKERARQLLANAAKERLGFFKNENWEIGISCSGGGFMATAYCDPLKREIEQFDLKFVFESCEAVKSEIN